MEGNGGNITAPDTSVNQGLGDVVESSAKRVTGEDVEQARAKEREAYSKLMDNMEASVETQGQWFVKLGARAPITETRQATESKFMGIGKRIVDREETVGYDDNRALILKARDRNDKFGVDQEEFTVVTSDGIFVAPFYTSELNDTATRRFDNVRDKHAILVNLTTGGRKPESSSYSTKPRYGGTAPHIVLDVLRDDSRDNSVDLKRGDLTTEDFQKRVQESIALTESPHKANLEKANNRLELASTAADLVSALPPRE